MDMNKNSLFKDGDILINKYKKEYIVYKEKDSSLYINFYIYLDRKLWKSIDSVRSEFRSVDYFRLATEQEIKYFHEKLHNMHLDWDSNKKQLIEWYIPKENKVYYTIKVNKGKFKIYSRVNINNNIDKQLIKSHNCFDTYENAEKVLNKINKVLCIQ